MAIESVNPATGERVASYDAFSQGQIDAAVRACAAAQPAWAERSFAERAAPLRAAGRLLREEKQALAELMAREMGKPLAQGVAEVEKCAWVCEYYAERPRASSPTEPVATDAKKSFVCFEPLGIVLAVMPWNFPFWQVFRFAAPALMAGNGGLLKHASNVPGCALAIESLLQRAGLPDGLFRTLVIGSGAVGALIDRPRDRGGDAHREHAGGPRGGRARGRRAEEDGARARRQRRLRDPRRRGRPGGGRDLRREPAHQRRPELHRRQALRRRRAAARRVRGARSSTAWRARKVGDPLGAGVDVGPHGARRPPRRDPRAGRAERREGRAPPAGRRVPGRSRRVLPADRARRTCDRARPPTTRRSSARSRP